MDKYVILYNPGSGNGSGAKAAEQLKEILKDAELRFENVTKIGDYKTFFDALKDEKPVLVGGDGTLNYLVNHYDADAMDFDLYYYPAGSGNDFYNDLREKEPVLPFVINKYLKGLPTVTVKGQTYKVVNGVGYGIDGYCCEEGDRQRALSDKPVDYTAIAIKGLLFKYKPTNAKVVVDGVEHHYSHCWLAPTMNGRFYGGGMNATPAQDRLDPDRKLSTLIMYKTGKIRTLIIFPNIFKGTHIEHTKSVEVFTGHKITVSFDRPVALQIDGETILGVSEYTMVKE